MLRVERLVGLCCAVVTWDTSFSERYFDVLLREIMKKAEMNFREKATDYYYYIKWKFKIIDYNIFAA